MHSREILGLSDPELNTGLALDRKTWEGLVNI